MHYLVQSRDQIFVKGYGFLCVAKNMDRQIGKNISKILSSKTVKNLLIMLNNLLQMQLKLFQKERFKKQQKQMVI